MKFIEASIRTLVLETNYGQAARYILDLYLQDKYKLGLLEISNSYQLSFTIDIVEQLIKEMIEDDSFDSEEILYCLNDMFSGGQNENLIFDL